VLVNTHLFVESPADMGRTGCGADVGGGHTLNDDAEAAALLQCELDGDGGTSDGQFAVASRKLVV
jgi:hypothetical protein